MSMVHVCYTMHVDVRGQLYGNHVSSRLCGFQRLNLGCWALYMKFFTRWAISTAKSVWRLWGLWPNWSFEFIILAKLGDGGAIRSRLQAACPGLCFFSYEVIYFLKCYLFCKVFWWVYVCAWHVCLVPEEVRRLHHISGTGVNELLWATVWVPRIKFRSSERQQVLLPAEPSFQTGELYLIRVSYCIPLSRSMMWTILLCHTLPPSIDWHLKPWTMFLCQVAFR